MVKAIISALVSLVVFITASYFETAYVQNTFNNVHASLEVAYEKTKSETITLEEINAVKESWFSSKEKLHMFIPHNEIKEVDLWISESATLIKSKNYEDALSKIEVCMELVKQICKTFSLRLENVL